MDKNLITIAEYAKIRGCSTAAVYKRLETTLKTYIKTVDKKTYLSRQVLIDEGLITVDNQENGSGESLEGVELTVDNGYKPKKQEESPALLEVVRVLEKQLEAKEREIERLHQDNEELKKQLNEAVRHNQEHTDKLTELLAQSQELNRNNQVLLAQAQQPPKQIEETVQEEPPPQEQPQQKRSWLYRFFMGE